MAPVSMAPQNSLFETDLRTELRATEARMAHVQAARRTMASPSTPRRWPDCTTTTSSAGTD
eukprot:1297476-Rhodomonas_salina.1